jgi:(S)-2-hydroxyglutarate dehydrogenase
VFFVNRSQVGIAVDCDVIVIGGGIVGLATALKINEALPGVSIVVLEKEAQVGLHQSGHNSGVIHAGIYYAPGSMKSRLCREGVAATTAFCEQYNIPFNICGKLLVATNEDERVRMDALYERATQNQVSLERLDAAELRRREPNIIGVGALFSPTTGIVDYRAVCAAMATEIATNGGHIALNAPVTAIREDVNVTVTAGGKDWTARYAVVCGGLQSDRLARMAGLEIDFRVVPFRGEYFRLPPERNDVVKSLIYPVPNADLPFLGIHLTRMADGGVTVGPNAVLGFAREGYRKFSFSAHDVGDFLRFPGFWKLIRGNMRAGLSEALNSLLRRYYLRQCQKYCPGLTLKDLQPEVAGIRAQAVLRDGTMLHDFLFKETPRTLHVCNAPSPAATSALPIGRIVADRMVNKMHAG